MGADDTGRVDPKTVQYCHANYEPICYNGMFPLVDQGYQASFIKTLCGHYRSMLVQTCQTQQGLWKKVDDSVSKYTVCQTFKFTAKHTCSAYRNADYKRGCERYKQNCLAAGK
uniref:Uncharacterized protein n=1 Tax=Romanomermis culicivorax TaxID=13658 RepID=A0A915KZV7_ROMCU